MKEIVKFELLQQCINELDTEEGFEAFDEIYDAIKQGDSIFEMNDIRNLCLILKNPPELMEPHQLLKIEKMTFITIDEYNKVEGFNLLLSGLEQIVDYNIIETQVYLKMLISSYNDEELRIFAELIRGYNIKFRNKIYNLITEVVKINPELYGNKAKVILEMIQV